MISCIGARCSFYNSGLAVSKSRAYGVWRYTLCDCLRVFSTVFITHHKGLLRLRDVQCSYSKWLCFGQTITVLSNNLNTTLFSHTIPPQWYFISCQSIIWRPNNTETWMASLQLVGQAVFPLNRQANAYWASPGVCWITTHLLISTPPPTHVPKWPFSPLKCLSERKLIESQQGAHRHFVPLLPCDWSTGEGSNHTCELLDKDNDVVHGSVQVLVY